MLLRAQKKEQMRPALSTNNFIHRKQGNKGKPVPDQL